MWTASSDEHVADPEALRAWREAGYEGQPSEGMNGMCAICGVKCGNAWQTSRWPGASYFFYPQLCCCSQEHLIQVIQQELVGWSPEEDWEWQLWTYPWKPFDPVEDLLWGSTGEDEASSSSGVYTGEVDEHEGIEISIAASSNTFDKPILRQGERIFRSEQPSFLRSLLGMQLKDQGEQLNSAAQDQGEQLKTAQEDIQTISEDTIRQFLGTRGYDGSNGEGVPTQTLRSLVRSRKKR